TPHNRCSRPDRCKASSRPGKSTPPGRRPRSRYTCSRNTAGKQCESSQSVLSGCLNPRPAPGQLLRGIDEQLSWLRTGASFDLTVSIASESASVQKIAAIKANSSTNRESYASAGWVGPASRRSRTAETAVPPTYGKGIVPQREKS